MKQSYGIEGYLYTAAFVLFILLLVVEKNFPTSRYQKYLKASFKTNTGAFLVNNVIMSIFLYQV
jgi:hypothetical protein